MAEPEQVNLTTLTVELLSAFVSNNTIDSAELASLIQNTHSALAGINAPPPVEPPAPEFEPAISIRKSLGSRDHILSLIDGKPYKTLKRHLSGHGADTGRLPRALQASGGLSDGRALLFRTSPRCRPTARTWSQVGEGSRARGRKPRRADGADRAGSYTVCRCERGS